MKKISKIAMYILILISCVIAIFSLYMASEIYHCTFEQNIYSLLKSGGTSTNALAYGFIYVSVGTILLFLLLILPTFNFKKSINIKMKLGKKNINKQIFPIKNIKRYGLIIAMLSIISLGCSLGFFEYIGNILKKTELFDNYYVKDAKLEFPVEKQNLIYVYLESTETSNVSKENGGVFEKSIMPNLERLALENVNFSNNDLLGGAQGAYGTNWTASGMIAQTSGIPLKIVFDDFATDNSANFNKITTLGDILSTNGYKNYLLLGSDASFGGRESYFKSHNYIIDDYYTAIIDGRIANDYHEWWGYEDSKLFDFAKDKLKKIANDEGNFNLTILTANTHFTNGYLENDCESLFDEKYSNSFYCSDQMIGDFIEWVKGQEFYKNTTIIISGDHLTMQKNFYNDTDKNYVRTIYNVIINPRTEAINSKNRVFTTMDMYPSTIASLGIKIEGNRLGLGTNLFSDKKTIPEEIGLEKFNNELKKYSKYYNNNIR